MSLTADSPVHSSSSDDFAAILDAELDSASDASPEPGEVEEKEEEIVGDVDDGYNSDHQRIKRRKVEVYEEMVDSHSSKCQGEAPQTLGSSPKKNVCPHPGIIGGMCIRCGQIIDDESGVSRVAFGYIHKNLRLANDEVARLRDKDFKNLLRHKKLYLVLDLDHTLLNSTRLADVTIEERYLEGQRDTLPDTLKNSLFRLEMIHMMTKLRPFVNTFLKEASNLFEMYIYTMGERAYALEMAKLLDPGGVYFHSRVIAQGDCTQKYQKGLDIVLGQESAVLILDDTEAVWGKHKENLILMERYHFFASSCRQFGFNCTSLSELRNDESETEGALATVLKILQQIHSLFFDPEHVDNLEQRDVRQVLKSVRKEILKDCKVVFSRVFPTNSQAEDQHIWKIAEKLGATCSTELDPQVTHVVSMDAGTDKSRWAMQEKKFLVHPRWIEASNYLWKKQPEEKFPVSQAKDK
ncbi:RNA polymerase II C-terminal domain phosphatase-like 4 [Olea europaea subsp. europaea]|uniref:RNA polymerase II C-terminal domain phosphatase-like n=1 Tax=Olea europaea subsp. europaea TaxID=158383 RepID=A0A8S0UXL1_OLEEU|nr:RNA polymerase II C-terminal domain phosphatase-like 4 [Olea europaea subsp. europaea]